MYRALSSTTSTGSTVLNDEHAAPESTAAPIPDYEDSPTRVANFVPNGGKWLQGPSFMGEPSVESLFMRQSLRLLLVLASWFGATGANADTQWTTPTLPNGQPDLQGTWENN